MNVSELQVPKSAGYRTSVAYWFGFLKQDLPSDLLEAKRLKSCMTLHFDREEQAWDENHIKSGLHDIFDYFQPIAPVSLAELWSPFPMAIQLLGKPIHSGTSEDSWPAYAVFAVPEEPARRSSPSSVHAKHFARLTNLCITAAKERHSSQILLVAMHGWSYRDARRMTTHVRNIMGFAGYRFAERRIFPWWKLW
jgi:hypothetical protein